MIYEGFHITPGGAGYKKILQQKGASPPAIAILGIASLHLRQEPRQVAQVTALINPHQGGLGAKNQAPINGCFWFP